MSNSGFSGTPLWRLHAERDAQQQTEVEAAVRIPEGFRKKDGIWYWSEKRQVFWNVRDGQFYVWDPQTQKHTKLHEAKTYDVIVSAGFICHERATEVKHVIVKDLAKAAQALRLSIGHLDRPCALYALYEGHRGSQSGNLCTDFCARHLHGKLLPKLAAFQGYWEDSRLQLAMQDSFTELDASFAEKHTGVRDGCCATVALLTGNRLVVASLGDIPTILCFRSGENEILHKAHASPDPDVEDDDEDEEDDDEDGANVGPTAATARAGGGDFRWTRAFGDLDLKNAAGLQANPDVKVVHLQHRHHGFAFICRTLYACIGGKTAVSTVFRRSAGRPRMASGALVDAAVQWLGNVEQSSCSLASVVALFDKVEDSSGAPPPEKKRRITEVAQVRLRHILLKHRDCKSTIDKVRGKQVKRTRADAERLLRNVLEECEADTDRKTFTQRCRELSECQTSLKSGELVGDIGWVKRGSGKYGDAFEVSTFSLQVNQLSDLIDSDQGIHVVLRSA